MKGGKVDHIKVSRGEENIFIWCVFLAVIELVIDGAEAYDWVKFLYIDDPISSLDDNNTIAVASDLAQLLVLMISLVFLQRYSRYGEYILPVAAGEGSVKAWSSSFADVGPL